MMHCTGLPNRISRYLTRELLAGVLLVPFGLFTANAADDFVTIGVSAPQSGGGADYGTAFVNGIKLALKELNDEITVSGKKIKVKISICDDEFKADKATNCARKLTSQEGARFVINPGTYASVPVLSFNQEKGAEFLVMGASGDPSVTSRNNKLFIRTWSNATRTMPGFVSTLIAYSKAQSAGIEKVALMEETNSDFGAAWNGNFRKEWERNGKEIVGRAIYNQNGTDFYAQLTPLLAKQPDLITLTTICEPSSLVIKQARELGYKGTFVNQGGCTAERMLKLLPAKDVEGMLFESARWALDAAELADFRKRYAAAFGVDPQIISAVGYMDVFWLARSMEAAKTTSDPLAVRAAMPGIVTQLQPNLLGWGSLDESGDIGWPMHVSFIKNGARQNFTGN